MFPKIFAADVLGDAAQGDREVLLVDLLEHHLDRAVVELDDVLEGEQQQADLLGELAVGLRQLVEHVALGRAVGVVEDVGQRLDATGGRVLLAR